MPKIKKTDSDPAITINAEPTTFKEAYEILKNNAEALERSEMLDIDNLVNVVEQSISAYKVCQARIHAVETALKNAFDDTTLSS